MTFITTILAVIWLASPGLLLSMRQQRKGEYLAAAATVSIVAMALLASLFAMLLFRITGQYSHGWITLATTAPVVIWTLWTSKRAGIVRPDFEWQSLLPSAFAIAISVYCYAIGYAPQSDGSLDVHSWYNADWFKHLGHAHAVSNLGLPARDIFAGGEPLHYYWLFYVIPAAASALNGDAAGSLYWVNHIVTGLFWILLYGVLRRTGASPWQSGLLGMAGCIIFSAQGTIFWIRTGLSMQEFIASFQPSGPVLISLGLYIPQHTMMLAILLAWSLIDYLDEPQPIGGLRILTLAALASAGAVSTMFGAICLVIYGLTRMAKLQKATWKPIIAELAIVGIASIAVIFFLRILDPGLGGNAISSPLFETETTDLAFHQRLLVTTLSALATLGPAFLIGIALLSRWNRKRGAGYDPLLIFAAFMLVIGFAGTILPEALMDNLRVAREVRLRAAYPAAIGALIALAWAMAQIQSGNFKARTIYAILGACTLLALPSAILRVQWHGTKGPEFFTHVPADDIRTLDYLAQHSTADSIIWQFPEAPELADGSDDTWVPILAGRMIAASLRATDYPKTAPRLAAMERFFNGSNEPIDARVSWVYLSRQLHPASYEMLVARMSNDTGWKKAYCLRDACLFKRSSIVGAK